MPQARPTKSLFVLGWGILAAGCASSGPPPLGYGVRHIPNGDRSAVFDAAESALVSHGYTVDRADRTTGVITAQPVSTESLQEPGRGTSRRLSSRGEMRRLAKVRIARAGDVVSVYCRVIYQEKTTRAHRIFAQDRELTDTPGVTPIEREAATTEQQNIVWRDVRRDKAAEQRILRAILGQIDGT